MTSKQLRTNIFLLFHFRSSLIYVALNPDHILLRRRWHFPHLLSRPLPSQRDWTQLVPESDREIVVLA